MSLETEELMINLLTDHIFSWENFERIFCSLVLLFILLIILRPNVQISPYIAKKDFDTDTDGYEYLFKVINKSFFPLFDLKVSLIKLVPFVAEGGTNFRTFEIKLRVVNLGFISGFRFRDTEAKYATIFVTNEDLEEILNDDQSKILLSITCRHGLSGLSKIVTQEFTSISKIKDGYFVFGNNTNIS